MRLERLQDNDVARVYRMLYHSTSVDGSDVVVSGTIWVPASAPPVGGFPIIAWAPGNNGSGDPCAYSAPDDPTRIDYALLMFELVRKGYVVAYTDYEGHGTRFPYLFAVGESQTHSLVDAARAARDLLGNAASDRVIVAGHSLGADAATETLRVAPGYAGGLDIRGALALEGGADIADLVADGLGAGVIADVVRGTVAWATAYPELELTDVLTARAVADTRSLEKTCEDPPSLGAWPQEEVFAASPLDVPTWRSRIEASRVTDVPFPVFFAVAPASTRHLDEISAVARRLCQADDAVRLESYRGATHDGIVVTAKPDYMAWIASRFAGDPATGNCEK